MADSNPSPHVVVVSSPGMGHVTPLAKLTKLLILCHQFTATFVTFSDPPCSLPSSVSTVQLPLLPLQDLPSDAHIVTRICLTIAHSVPLLHEILISLRRTARLTAVILDFLGSDFLSVVRELNIPSYLFIAPNFFFLSFMLHLPTLKETTVGEFRDLPEPLRLPGCVPLKGEDFLEPIQEKGSEVCAWVVHLARHYDLFCWNSSEQLRSLRRWRHQVLKTGFPQEGLMERTKERGILVLSWDPQVELLGHNATGGFVSHCGWNSTLESLANGVPMVAWPLYSEQRMNAVLLVEAVKVALRASVGENGVVRRGEVAKVAKMVKELMECEKGKEVRLRMQEMKKETASALVKEGSS